MVLMATIAPALLSVFAGCGPAVSPDAKGCVYPAMPFQVNKADYYQMNLRECPLSATNLGSCACPASKSAASYCMKVRMTPMWTHGRSTCDAVSSDDIKEGTIDPSLTNDSICAYEATQRICN